MVSCLAASRYTMLADIYKQVNQIDPETNETKRGWVKEKTITCYVWPYLDGGIKGAGTTERFMGEKYESWDYARVRSSQKLIKTQRLTNVRTKRGNQLVFADLEVDPTGNTPIVFNVDGSSPMINDLTGKPNEFMSTLSRAEVRK